MKNDKVNLTPAESLFREIVQRYNHNKYWKYRAIVIDPNKGSKIVDLFRLWYIKRADAFSNASMGTHLNCGAKFKTPPILPHGLYGIIVSHNAVIGSNCTIFHQVTIGNGSGGAPTIGDNCYISAGAKITGNIHIGDNVVIGTNCVVFEDVPDNTTVVMQKPRLLRRKIKSE